MLTKEYAKSFKREIITPLIHFIDKNLVYRSEKFVSKKSYIASKIENREITDYSGDDFIYGNIDGVNIKLSELDVMVRNGDETRLSFFGLFVEAEFPKHFKAHTLVHSRRVIIKKLRWMYLRLTRIFLSTLLMRLKRDTYSHLY